MDSAKKMRLYATYIKRKERILALEAENKLLRRALRLMAARLKDEVDHFDNGVEYGGCSAGPSVKEWIKIFMDRAKEEIKKTAKKSCG
ncbi:MAG: hypothetical protein IJ741_07125 [Schwartzia sp.]|nr:hypothetical protein [Schwartzia sp. (in: firmicutes)]